MTKSVQKNSVYYLTVDEAYAGQRLDNFLITHLKIPRSRIYRILRKGEVRVNKKRAEPSYRLQAQDEIRIPPVSNEQKAMGDVPESLKKQLKGRILYEDKNLFIINKPSGLAVHGGSGVKWGVIEAFKAIYPKLPQLELVHRLDLETSGCLILAKKRSTLREVHDLLRQGEVKKWYLALTEGHWTKAQLKVDLPLKKNILQSGERVVRVSSEGKDSKTLFEVIKKYSDCTLVRARLLTGRTHQIRVHAQFQKHPLAGDEKYGDKEFNKAMRQKGLKRMFLHAEEIRFVLPSTGEEICVKAELDEDLAECLKHLI